MIFRGQKYAAGEGALDMFPSSGLDRLAGEAVCPVPKEKPPVLFSVQKIA